MIKTRVSIKKRLIRVVIREVIEIVWKITKGEKRKILIKNMTSLQLKKIGQVSNKRVRKMTDIEAMIDKNKF